MENANSPAMPAVWVDFDSMGNQVVRESFHGLTKREMFAMQGLLSNSVMGDSSVREITYEWVNDITEASVEFADTLLAKLEEK